MKETKKSFSADVQPNVNAGFSDSKPSNAGEIIDASFECVRTVEKESGTFVILVIHPKGDGVVTRAYNASDLLGKEVHPCVKKGDKYIVDDENFVCTWEDGEELTFNKRS